MNKRILSALSVMALIQLSACGKSVSADVVEVLTGLEGVFVSDGYGYVLDLTKENAKLFHLSGDNCVYDKQGSAHLKSMFSPNNIAKLEDGDGLAFGNQFEPHKIKFQKQNALPTACQTPSPDTVEGNFEAFAAAFNSHYMFFEQHGVDWQQQVDHAKPNVQNTTTDKELFEIFSNMISSIDDAHLELNASFGDDEHSFSPSTSVLNSGAKIRAQEQNKDHSEIVIAALGNYLEEGVMQTILQGRGKEAAGGKLRYGIIGNDIGYINVLMLTGYTSDEIFSASDDVDDEAEHALINQLLDTVLSEFIDAKVKAVIIDASINFGGQDYLGREIASRFAKEREFAYSKRALDANSKEMTNIFIEPTDRPSFYGPVYLVTTDSTVSAGEIMTMSLRALPNVTHVGQATRGALSDVLEKKLPNGWELSLSNEVYYDSDGITWEAKGIQPERELEIFTEAELVAPHPQAIGQLVQQIKAELWQP